MSSRDRLDSEGATAAVLSEGCSNDSNSASLITCLAVGSTLRRLVVSEAESKGGQELSAGSDTSEAPFASIFAILADMPKVVHLAGGDPCPATWNALPFRISDSGKVCRSVPGVAGHRDAGVPPRRSVGEVEATGSKREVVLITCGKIVARGQTRQPSLLPRRLSKLFRSNLLDLAEYVSAEYVSLCSR